MSVLRLPEPANWPAGGGRLIRLTLVMAAFFTVALFFGTRSVLRGDYLEAAVGAGLVLPGVLVIVTVQFVSRGQTTLRADHDATGTTLMPDRIFSTLGILVIAMMILVGVVFVTFTLTGHLHVFDSRRGQAAAVTGMSLATVTAISGLITAWRRGGIGYVKLSSAGIDIANILRTESVTWNDVIGVDDHSKVNKKTRKAIVLELQDGTEKTIDGADFYVPNGVGLYWMVRHYWRHSGDRAELADDRALERLREGRFDVE